MPGVLPPPDFGRAKLEIETILRGRTFGRIYWSTYPVPLGYGKSPSRFSDPRPRVDVNRFGVLYLGDSLKVCFLETVLRDRREGLTSWRAASIQLAKAGMMVRHSSRIICYSSK
ncbi:RES domain-containing protein [Mesorhizobium sp.]|uniref:RES domain-containing protein n=1 Tax=Mesorhizobium sp. TaxID=1871066 RepID=UPI0025D5D001|nr:RES domain-containing protein [Mesorhizobium sp.]